MSPALDKSPQIDDSPNPYQITRMKRRNPTGTRKNITPDTLIPLDASTQTRSYVTPSTTSRKELPAVFAREAVGGQGWGNDISWGLYAQAGEIITLSSRNKHPVIIKSPNTSIIKHLSVEKNRDLARISWKERQVMLQLSFRCHSLHICCLLAISIALYIVDSLRTVLAKAGGWLSIAEKTDVGMCSIISI